MEKCKGRESTDRDWFVVENEWSKKVGSQNRGEKALHSADCETKQEKRLSVGLGHKYKEKRYTF